MISLEKSEQIIERFGLRISDTSEWRRLYSGLRANAKTRGVKCKLSFSQYVRLAVEAGLKRPSRIGKTKGKYQMSRIGDSGDYVKGNCRFLTVLQNQREKLLNGGAAQGAKKGAFTRSKPFRAVSPTGKIHKSRNLVKFAKKHDLHRQSMCRVFLGERPHHKGWTGNYIEQ